MTVITRLLSVLTIPISTTRTKDLGIDQIFANEVIIGGKGTFTGKAMAMVDDNDKHAVAQHFHKEFSENIIAIGDSDPDTRLVGCAEHTLIAYNALEKNKTLLSRANHRLDDGELNSTAWKFIS